MLALAVVCQLAALTKAPLIVVQPLGAIALVITTLLNARVSGVSPTKRSLVSIIACVGGIFIFVLFAALFAAEHEITEIQLFTILTILLLVIILLGTCWLILRRRMRALFYVTGAGILYGFVATLAKVVITPDPVRPVRLADAGLRDRADRRRAPRARTSCRPRTAPGRPTSSSPGSRSSTPWSRC